ncbi:DUF6385 domain-containing protein [Paenibacillus rhizoplanae]
MNTRVEISADGTNYFVDTTGDNPLPAGSVDVIVPARFLKYTRLSYQSATPGAASTLNVIFLMHKERKHNFRHTMQEPRVHGYPCTLGCALFRIYIRRQQRMYILIFLQNTRRN